MNHGTLPEVVNNASWELNLEFVDDETDAAWFLQASPPDEITLHVRDKDTKVVELSLSLSGGELTVTGDGEVRVTVIDLSALDSGTYEVCGLYTATTGGVVKPYFVGFLPVLDGF